MQKVSFPSVTNHRIWSFQELKGSIFGATSVLSKVLAFGQVFRSMVKEKAFTTEKDPQEIISDAIRECGLDKNQGPWIQKSI